MFSLVAPQSSRLSSCLPLSPPNDHHVIVLVDDDSHQGDTIGVVLSGSNLFKRVVLTGSLLFHHVQNDYTCEFYATENNCLGIPVGRKCSIALQTSFDTTGLGVAFKTDGTMYNVTLTCEDVVSKKRSKLKPVVLPNQTLNKEESIRACLVWLDKHNFELAPRHNLQRLVWCEETASSRSNSGLIRNCFKIDIHDNNKKKSCSNITSAIEAMQEFTKSDFYDDMLTKSMDYPELARAISSSRRNAMSSSKIPTHFLPK
jgi:hypothetical protein